MFGKQTFLFCFEENQKEIFSKRNLVLEMTKLVIIKLVNCALLLLELNCYDLNLGKAPSRNLRLI